MLFPFHPRPLSEAFGGLEAFDGGFVAEEHAEVHGGEAEEAEGEHAGEEGEEEKVEVEEEGGLVLGSGSITINNEKMYAQYKNAYDTNRTTPNTLLIHGQ
ncbi:hypothetical protein HDU96_006182 [Phlyctochytrium bullatum]|nr:hypothetical protein HDU96_006182 [Phlyctochytrium bullatum]